MPIWLHKLLALPVYAPDDGTGTPPTGGDPAPVAPVAPAAAAPAAAPFDPLALPGDAPAPPPVAPAAPAAAPVAPEAPPAPVDWRASLIEGLADTERQKAQERLGRFATGADVAKSILNADGKINELTTQMKSMLKVPGPGAKPEDIQAFREAIGVPKDVSGYKVYRPQGVEETPELKAYEQSYLMSMHKQGATQAQVEQGLRTYYDIVDQGNKALKEHSDRVAKQTETELRTAYGNDYDANIQLATRFLSEKVGDDLKKRGMDLPSMMALPMQDGTKLGDFAPFVKMIVGMSREASDGGTFLGGEFTATTDVNAEINGMMAKMGTSEYEKPEFQDRLKRLIAVKNHREGRREFT